ncbi:MAG: cobaltochelatase subunit CobN [Candidatus Bathyarchaeota archaeon]|nr:cobaltochelatase subunit CobN [Candidatus Bathyarchaeota archaeon]
MKHLKVAFATTNPSDTKPFMSALQSVNQRFGDVITARLWSGGDFGNGDIKNFENIDQFIQFAKTSDVTIIHLFSSRPEFDPIVSLLKSFNVKLFVICSGSQILLDSTNEQKDCQNIYGYLKYGGKKNFENLLLFLLNRFVADSYAVAPPVLPVREGIYHPDFEYTPTLNEYMQKRVQPDKLTVGIWFHQSHIQSEDTDFVDSLIREIEQQDANVLPVFFSNYKEGSEESHGLACLIENYFLKEGKPTVDVVISALFFSFCMSQEGSKVSSALARLGVPVLKAVLTCNSFEDWRDTIQGLSVTDIPSQVALPEFDGFLITVPIGTMVFAQTNASTGDHIIRYLPIPERINKLVRLSLNWAKLRHIPNSEKKVAIFFHNYPPRNDTIGHVFGLDSSVSAMSILQNLKKQSFKLDGLPESAQKLMDDVINGLTNDQRWLSADALAERAVAKVSGTQYAKWFGELPKDARDKMVKSWGAPPGKVFNHNGKLLIAGILNGNVFIALQPPRGFLENSAAIYHDPDLAMSHHYYAYYRWIRDVFKADVVIHLGTHGSLEWLPGKSVGLSASCFPDAAISDLPNVYPYIITNPGEGAQAKRRSYCCIIDHLIPVMHNADTYEEMSQLEVQMQEYYHAKVVDLEKLPVLQKLIWENVVQAKLDQDLEVTDESVFADFDGFLERLLGYLSELSDTQIRDGLHLLGVPPTDTRLEEFLFTLTRLSNGSVPSLRQSVAELKGYDYEDLLANRGKLNADGKTNGDVIKELNTNILELMKRFDAAGFKKQSIDAVISDVLGASTPNIKKCLAYIAVFLVPALNATTDELTNTLSACMGNYIPPGPSGSITRGMADILPTGRNFYSVDPRAIPTQAAWRVGVALGDTLLERYLKEEGKYPESVGIILWAVPTMKTKGDDVAEILYLLGVQPVWEESSGRVVGIEPIPLEKLKRPRIDVTIRISGLLRDTFPNLIHLLDGAVALVAGLKEFPEKNYIVKHVEAELKRRATEGVDVTQAKAEACYRIFGDRPAAYGCGVSHAIDSKNWKDQKDLSDIYIIWGSYVYSRKLYGVMMPDQFKLRLSEINLTVKNDDSREYDILDCDDWYDAHGGMINAVRVFTGKAPRSFCGDSSDPDRVKVRSTAEETCHVFRSRLLNPKYLQGLKRHGYQGAAELSRVPDFVLGWDATVEVVEDWMWEGLAKKYALDAEMQEWLKEVNPYALQNITERLLEAISRGLWKASEEMKQKLQQLYLQVEGLIESKNEKK